MLRQLIAVVKACRQAACCNLLCHIGVMVRKLPPPAHVGQSLSISGNPPSVQFESAHAVWARGFHV